MKPKIYQLEYQWLPSGAIRKREITDGRITETYIPAWRVWSVLFIPVLLAFAWWTQSQ